MLARLKKWFNTTGKPATAGYEHGPSGLIYANWHRRPPWSYWYADLMLLDPQVWFGLMIGNGPLMSARVEVKCKSAEIKQFIEEQWKRIWSKSATQILRTKQYGFLAFEVVCKEVDGRIEFDYLRDFHPVDVGQLRDRKTGFRTGIRVRQIVRMGGNGTLDLMGPKGLWLTYGQEFSRSWGRALLERCYQPWYDKNSDNGALDLRRLHGFKDAWMGDMVKYPFRIFDVPGVGKVHGRDLAREIAENRASGGVVMLPSTVDKDGNPEWDYTPPATTGGATAIPDWIHDLDWDILDGLLVPKEVVEAGGTGGGWSGRSVPWVGFLAVRDQEFAEYVRAIKKQHLDPLALANFGKGADDFDVNPVPLVETMGQQVGEMGKPELTKPEPAGGRIPPRPEDGEGEEPPPAQQFSLTDFASAIAKAAAEVDRNPTEAEKAAGNYKKGHVMLHGLDITIETPKGAIRSGTDANGTPWKVEMPHHYGYIRQTESEADGDHVDVFVGPSPESELVVVIDQAKKGGKEFDEHKVMLGFNNESDARDGYLGAYSDGWDGLSSSTAMTLEQFKEWLENGETGEPVASQFSIADPPLTSRSKTADAKEKAVEAATPLAAAIQTRLARLLKKN